MWVCVVFQTTETQTKKFNKETRMTRAGNSRETISLGSFNSFDNEVFTLFWLS